MGSRISNCSKIGNFSNWLLF